MLGFRSKLEVSRLEQIKLCTVLVYLYLMLLQRRELSSEGVDVIRNQGPKREK